MSDTVLTGIVCIVTAGLMEYVAWVFHKYLMHGPLWVLHKSHHRPRRGWFELNDTFGLFFSSISIMLIYFGLRGHPVLLGAGLGMVVYGGIYFLVHDVLVHRRVRHVFVPRSGYLRRIYQAHRLHHALETKDGAVSFGFVYAPPAERLKARLGANAAEKALEGDGVEHPGAGGEAVQ
jgi:beta-carotene 3-hydroxylase